MKFEFDPDKSASNKVKHGINFTAAQALWNSPVIEIPANVVDGEMRYAALGKIAGVCFTVIVTYRGAVRRIISARPSSAKEAAIYAEKSKVV